MRKFQCLLFVLKRSCICYYIICMTVPLNEIILSKKTRKRYRRKQFETKAMIGPFFLTFIQDLISNSALEDIIV